MYGPEGPYHLFVGIDASHALAKMSFKEEDLRPPSSTNNNTNNPQSNKYLSDLTIEEKKVLEDWRKKLIDTRKYPIVGKLI